MKKLYTILVLMFLLFPVGFSQTFNQPASGSNSITTCSGNFYDPGGSLANYSNNQNSYMTICPSTPGQYVSVNFTAFNVENGFDYLYIFDGGSGGAIIGMYTGTTLPGVITATNSTGCLSFHFVSDGGTTKSGWTAAISCSATPGPAGQSVPTSADCGGGQGTTICSDVAFSANSNGEGEFDELNGYSWRGCLNTGEHQSSWYYFKATSGGTMEFTITPNTFVDYDWAIWGPSNTSLPCPFYTGQTPIRCTYAQASCTVASGATGLLAGNVDVSEAAGPCGAVTTTSAGVNAFVAPLTLVTGQYYVMCIDNFSNNNVSFTIDFSLTGGASLDCTPLPIVLENFNGNIKENYNQLYWVTSSELNNDYFIIEKSEDAVSWTELGRTPGAGTSNVKKVYSMADLLPYKNTYYRLSQTDINGTRVDFQPIVIQRNNGSSTGDIFGFYPNPVTDAINVQTFGEGDNILIIRDQTGKTIFNTVINGKTIQSVPLSPSIGSGLYFITVENQGQVQNEKIIIAR
jgi:hypothetical protein